MKTLIVTLFAVVSLVLAGFAFADSSGSSASSCGAAHGAFADVNGNFGWLGEAGGTPGEPAREPSVTARAMQPIATISLSVEV